MHRFVIVFLRYGPKEFDLKIADTTCLKDPPPEDINLMKGSKEVALTRGFLKYTHSDPKAIELANYLADAYVPDEHFYSTLSKRTEALLALNLNVTNILDEQNVENGCLRYSMWYPDKATCHGAVINSICNFGMADLDLVNKQKCAFANKFNSNADPFAVLCQVKWLLNLMEKESLKDRV